jgi:hypothetical protein
MGGLRDQRHGGFRCKEDGKTHVTSTLSAWDAQAVRAGGEGETKAAVTAGIVLGTMVSLHQIGERAGEEESSVINRLISADDRVQS